MENFICRRKKFWYKKVLNIYTYQADICPKSHRHTLGINESQKEDILNPIYARCGNKSCKKNIV